MYGGFLGINLTTMPVRKIHCAAEGLGVLCCDIKRNHVTTVLPVCSGSMFEFIFLLPTLTPGNIMAIIFTTESTVRYTQLRKLPS